MMNDKPKRPRSAYMLWINSARDQIKADNPGFTVVEIANKGGELWRAMKDKSVWEEKAAKEMEQYTKYRESYNANVLQCRVMYDNENGRASDYHKNSPDQFIDNKPNRVMSYNANGEAVYYNMKTPNQRIDNKPKRPRSAYMLWLNSAREQLKADYPGLKVIEIIKRGEELWRAMKDKSVWEEKAAKAIEQYTKDLESYNVNNDNKENTDNNPKRPKSAYML